MKSLPLTILTLSLFSISTSFLGCSAADTEDSESKVLKGSDSEEIQDGVESTLEIESTKTPLQGSKVTIPTGSLAVGSTVGLKPVADQPDSFSSTGFVAANDPVEITAVDSNGNPVTETINPLTIQLPVSGSSLADQTEDNLCVFLEWAEDQSMYVWRRSSIKISEGLASFDTTKLGIFQLVYCGNDTLEGDYKDAQTENIAGTASESLVELSIPQNEDHFSFRFNHTHICVGIGADNSDGKTEVWNFSDHNHTPGEAIDLKIYKGGLKDISELDDNKLGFVFVAFQDATQTCDTSVLDDTKHVHNAIFAWFKLGSEIKSGNLKGSLGDTNASFGLEKVNMALGRSDSGSQAASAAADACLGSHVTSNSGGIVEITTSLAANYKIGDSSTQSLPRVYTTDSSAKHKEYLTVNSKHCIDSEVNNINNAAIDQPYSVFFRNSSTGTTHYLTPVDISLSISALFPRVCVQVYPKGSSLASKNETSRSEIILSSVLVSQSESSPYKLYVPFQDAGVYDLAYKVYSDATKDCSASTDLFVPAENKILNSSIVVQYP